MKVFVNNDCYHNIDTEELLNEHNRFRYYKERIKMEEKEIDDSDIDIKEILLQNVKHKIIAQQLTLIMYQIYKKIPFDSIKNNLTDYYTMSYIKIFNQIVIWVQYSILVNKDTKERAKIIKKWIKCCHYLLLMHNYHGLIAIHCALRSNPVFSGKLKTAWFKHKNIIKRKHHQKFKKISNIVSYNNNYHSLRNKMDHSQYSSLPVLPYYGIFQKDYQHFCQFKCTQKSQKMINSLLIKYNQYKQGQYIYIIHNPLIETWIHYKLGETLLINIDAINQMSDNVHNLDEK